MDTRIAALQKRMPEGVAWTRPEGGFSILVELPRDYSSVALLLAAIGKGVSFLPGPASMSTNARSTPCASA